MNEPNQTEAQVQADDLPLSGIRVVEFCHVVMGPTCGLVLAELGAEVIKVEATPLGDETRNLRTHAAGGFTYFNRGKKGIGLDLKSEGGRSAAHRLLREADVLLENYAPGTADRLGIGWEEISALNPRLVYCSLKGFLPGPYENRTALDELVQFSTGLAFMTGPPGRPLRAGASVVDITGGLFGAVAILAALRRRDVTGRGELVQSALYESSAFLLGQHMAGQITTGQLPEPLPIRPRSWGIYDTFTTADQQTIFLAIVSDKQWKAFCDRFSRPDLFAEERFDTNEKRRVEHDELHATIQKMFDGSACDPLIEMLIEAGLPAAPVRKPSDLFDDPQLNTDNRMSNTDFGDGKMARLPRLPITIGDGKTRASGQPPEFGEHTDGLLSGLGYSVAEIDELRRNGDVA